MSIIETLLCMNDSIILCNSITLYNSTRIFTNASLKEDVKINVNLKQHKRITV